MRTVNDMYGYSSTHSLPLLSNFNAPFWMEYIENYEHYDKLFRRNFYSFKYFLQNEDEELTITTRHFIDDVFTHLLVNEKKYSELYRIYKLEDEKYSITDNYDITETMDKTVNEETENVLGSRVDITQNSIGTQNNTLTGLVSPYDSSSFYNENETQESIGGRADNGNFEKGEQINNTDIANIEKYTLTRKGNIGVQTVTDMLTKYDKYWTNYKFYEMIFREISKELLLV